MCAPLDHLPFPEDKDPGSLSDRDEVVRNDDRRPPAHQTAQWLEDPMAGLGVEVGGRLVQDEDGCVANHRPRNGDPLALTAGEAPALLANNRRSEERRVGKEVCSYWLPGSRTRRSAGRRM